MDFDHTHEPNQHTLTRYRDFVDYMFQSKREGDEGFLHAAVGLAGEGGEVLEHMKKLWVSGRPLDRDEVLEEMGDSFHYFTMLMIKMEITLEDVINNNVVKLRKRFPEGWSREAAIARADKQVAHASEHRDVHRLGAAALDRLLGRHSRRSARHPGRIQQSGRP